MKKAAINIAAICFFIAVATLFFTQFKGSNTHHAWSRIFLDPNPAQDPFFVFDSYFIQNQFQSFSNFFSKSGVRKTLASRSGISETNYSLTEIGGVRGTRMIYFHFEGNGSNQILNIASNASIMLVEWYSTNYPTREIRFVDAGNYNPKTPFQMKYEDVCDRITGLWGK